MTMTLTDIPGILVGHATDEANRTGCTAVLCPAGAVGGVEVCGFAPGTRETELLKPHCRVEDIHAVLLTGGSAFGLAAATGVVRWLTERGYGHQTLLARVPLVTAAVIFDLYYNRTMSLPDEAMGYQAADQASTAPVIQGCVGAGAGATAGKLAGYHRAMKTGLGSAGRAVGDIRVAALAVVNPVGEVIDPNTGLTLAGLRTPDGSALPLRSDPIDILENFISPPTQFNTVLGVVATDAVLNKLQASRLAHMAAAGLARAIRPAHTLFDGDVVFTISTGQGPTVDENVLGALGAETLAEAIAAGARQAVSTPDLPAFSDVIRR